MISPHYCTISSSDSKKSINLTEQSYKNITSCMATNTCRSSAPQNQSPQVQKVPWFERRKHLPQNSHCPLHCMADYPHMPKNIIIIPSIQNTVQYYTHSIQSSFKCCPHQTSFQKRIHTQITHRSIRHWRTMLRCLHSLLISILLSSPFPVRTESIWPGCSMDSTQPF